MTYAKKSRPKKGGNKFSAKRTNNRRGRGKGKGGNKKENIHPSKFVKAASPKAEEEYVAQFTFSDFEVAPLLKKNIASRGFKSPSPIQDKAIPKGLAGKDIIGIANTGTGKTMAFAIPVLNRLLSDTQSRVLIMAPTRELAQQILEEMKTLMKGGNIYHALLIGGSSMHIQLKDLKRNPRIVIGTPGRIQDHINRKKLDLRKFDMVVLDEVDRMLDMGFVKDMRSILGRLNNENRQSFFFSATMDDKVRQLINEFSQEQTFISVKTGDTSDNVDQNVVKYNSREDKIEKLHEVLNENKKSKILIFDATKRGVDRLTKDLCARGFKAEATHGNKSQRQREKALHRFKTNQTMILVATDVAARGIDVKGVSHVINYSTPQSYDDYVHRIGRAGRAGEKGYALTFIEAKKKFRR
ncbi:MAG: DEAD/DEAH box helicase [Candidatus Moraniibacteriota bacterium]|jgi:ATP-dependent RNA helicase RhlE